MGQGILDLRRPGPGKVRGWCFLNGNVVREADLVDMVQDCVLDPRHSDPEVNASRKVLLVTAAWQRGHEHRDRHVIRLFEKLEIDGGWDGRFPKNIQNLSVYSMFSEFIDREPWLYRRYTEKQDQIKAVKRDYLKKNQHYVEEVHALLCKVTERFGKLTLFDLYYVDDWLGRPEAICDPEEEGEGEGSRFAQLRELSGAESELGRCRLLRRTMDHLIWKDREIFALVDAIEEHFLEESGVQRSMLYQEQRRELGRRILSSASVFIFGGRVYVLMNRLRFYRLKEFFRRALAEGTNVYGISAGSLAQTDRFSISFERRSPGGFLRAADHGMGLVHGLWVIPHATDHDYVREAHPNALSFFAIRQRGGVVVGLSEKSLLLNERYRDPLDGNEYERYVSIGEDPVLVFGERGHLQQLHRHDEIFLEGCKFYQGKPQLARADELRELERLWRTEKERADELGPAL